MKKALNFASAAMALFLVFLSANAFAEEGKIQFCENLTDTFEVVNPGAEFPGPSVSWLASSPQPFGQPQITLSIYKDADATQSLLQRREIEVNPAWNNIGLRNMRIGDPGTYTFVLSQKGGEEIAKGTVTIGAKKIDEPVKPEEKVGGTLEELFKKYSPKK